MRRACQRPHCLATLEPPLQAHTRATSPGPCLRPASKPQPPSCQQTLIPAPSAKVPGRILCQVSPQQVGRPGAARWQGSPHPPGFPRVQPPCLKMEQRLGAWGRALGSKGQTGARYYTRCGLHLAFLGMGPCGCSEHPAVSFITSWGLGAGSLSPRGVGLGTKPGEKHLEGSCQEVMMGVGGE